MAIIDRVSDLLLELQSVQLVPAELIIAYLGRSRILERIYVDDIFQAREGLSRLATITNYYSKQQ